MQGIFPFVRADTVAGFGAAGLNLIVATVLLTLGLLLGTVVCLLAACPCLSVDRRAPITAAERRR
jgi:hypothetical protein